MSIQRILDNLINLEKDSIIKVQLKYELLSTSKLSVLDDSSIERHAVEFLSYNFSRICVYKLNVQFISHGNT